MKQVTTNVLVTYRKGKSDTAWSQFHDVAFYRFDEGYFVVGVTEANGIQKKHMIRKKVIERIEVRSTGSISPLGGRTSFPR